MNLFECEYPNIMLYAQYFLNFILLIIIFYLIMVI